MEPYIPDQLPFSIKYTDELVTAIAEANRAIAKYDGLLEQSSLELVYGTFIYREATLSSRIEGSRSSLDEVFENAGAMQAFIDEGEKRDDLNEIMNYVSALHLGKDHVSDRTFSLSILKELHSMLLGTGTVRGKQKNPGKFRSSQNWIGRPGSKVEEASFLPPTPIIMEECMENWEEYYLSNQPEVLVQVAIVHGQFEAIHPFEDGNGRLGRLMIPLFLYEKKVISKPNFYLSAYIERNKNDYVDALRGLNGKPSKWNEWILFFLRAITEQAGKDYEKIKEMKNLYEEKKEQFINLTHSQFAVPVLDAIFSKPIFTRKNIAIHLSKLNDPPTSPTLHNILIKLVEGKALQVVQKGEGRRGTLYVLDELMELLEST